MTITALWMQGFLLLVIAGFLAATRSCPDVEVPGGTVRRLGDVRLTIRCDETGEVSYLSCRSNRWIGTLPNCTSAVGCADYDVPEGVWARRDGNNMTLGCMNTSEIWHMVCIDNRWVGEPPNCPTAVGCADYDVPEGVWARRDRNSMTLGCMDTSQIWHMVCIDNRWVGEPPNCPTGPGHTPPTVGCDHPDIPGGWSLWHGDTLTAGCDGSSEFWHLMCVESRWVGQFPNCSEGGGCRHANIPGGWSLRQGNSLTVDCYGFSNMRSLECRDGQWIGELPNCTTAK